MCDYCGCRAHPAIASLSDDHELLLSLLADLRRGANAHDQAAAIPLLQRVHELLGPHATREEQGVFTELEHAGVAHSYIQMFETEHRQIHTLLRQASGDDWESATQDLIQTLTDHIGREESDLFPAAHQLLSPRQWDAVDRR